MSWNDPQLFWRQIAFDNVEVSAAYAAGADAEQDMARADARIGNL
jgi:hypothetical protein